MVPLQDTANFMLVSHLPDTILEWLLFQHTHGKTMAMTPEAWTVIGTGVVILIAIAASNRQIRSELNQVHAEIGQLLERMAKLEGLLEGLREAITGRKVS